MQKAKGFTLVEMLMAIIIVGALAGMMAISSGSAVDKTETTKCLANRRTLQSGLNVYRAEHGSLTFDAATVEKLKKTFDTSMGTPEISGSVMVIKDLCPAHGVITVANKGSDVTVTCSLREHGGGWTDAEIALALKTSKEMLEYMKSKTNLSLIDSEAPKKEGVLSGIGETVSKELEKMGIDLSDKSWQIQKVRDSIHIYISEVKLTDSLVGDSVNVTEYNYKLGTVTKGQMKVIPNTVGKSPNSVTFPILDPGSFNP